MSIELSQVRDTISTHFPSLWPAVEAGLATCATLLLEDNVNPVALIYVGPPSAGKTTVVSMFDGANMNGQPICYRSDMFTPAAFVSQSAKATDEQLAKIDLLPRIKHKVLLTPELSTIFRGKQDELAVAFSRITRILDGQGLKTDSGTHGQRGYEGDYLFAWLGATTPFDSVVWKVMAQLGSRMFFLVMDAVAAATVEELVSSHIQPVPFKEGLKQCQEAVQRFLESVYAQHQGVRKVTWNTTENPRKVLEGIARCATLLALMRTPYDLATPAQPESPHRANAVLYNLARGHALICGRSQLTADDLPMIAQITLSSMPERRRAVMLAFAMNDGKPLTVRHIQEAAGVSRHTAEQYMDETQWLGLATFEAEGTGKASQLVLKAEWAWCMTKDFRSLLLDDTTWQESGVETLTTIS